MTPPLTDSSASPAHGEKPLSVECKNNNIFQDKFVAYLRNGSKHGYIYTSVIISFFFFLTKIFDLKTQHIVAVGNAFV